MKDTNETVRREEESELNREEKERTIRAGSHNLDVDSTKEEVTVVEHVPADESTTKLNKIDQCLEEERNGEYAIIVKTSEEQSGAILDINNSSAEETSPQRRLEDDIEKEIGSSEENMSQFKVWKEF
ncbi:unnamed protein product [Lepeophtheirus salmonis]|uniref:(salmon louse) hypothetical protein n=1 Tax=Lepeophtheirus salmonis TaxID=72036 RepID=A0A7R8GZ13_LEPSM|nr:unnamed protein product [Lepeophtheirus salmonis]CAF2757385.1 unnamed protein product [Lepeophtheirus salmonis]